MCDLNKNSIAKKMGALINQNLGITVEVSSLEVDNNIYLCASNMTDHIKIENGDMVVVGDIDIHNYEKLIEKFELNKNVLAEDICCLLYKFMGIDFVEELVGEFSFVLYDKQNKTTFAVRDHLGVKPLFWSKIGNNYFFASDLFLLADQLDGENINYQYFMNFIDSNGSYDGEDTPFDKVYRVPSGSLLYLENNQHKLINYWDLSSITGTIKYSNEEEYIAEFNSLLYVSTNDRMKRNEKNTILLSGGLDSTSIFAMAKMVEENDEKYKVSSVSAVFEELHDCDERFFIEQLLSKYNTSGIYLNFDNELMFNNFPEGIPFSYEPDVSSLTFEFTYKLIKEGVDRGCTNFLTGFAGDHLLTGSLQVTRDFLKKGDIKKAFDYITNYSISTNTSAWENLFRYTLFPDTASVYMKNKHGDPYKSMKNKMKGIKNFHQKELYYRILNTKAHLFMDRVIGGMTGADIRHPLLDRRIVEFIYKIPGNMLLKDNKTKYILRESMNNVLPKDIINRINKTTHLAYTYKSLRNNWEQIYPILSEFEFINKFKPASMWKEQLHRWRNGLSVEDDFYTLLIVGLWYIKYRNQYCRKN